MFEKAAVILYYAITPTHMGAGDGVGVVDAPIQREIMTGYPVLYGSGLKGAIRHDLSREWKDQRPRDLTLIFGPESKESSEHAGAVSFSDANIVLFPVKSMEKGFVYVTSPLSLARLARLIEVSNGDADWGIEAPDDSEAFVASGSSVLEVALEDDGVKKVSLEYFEFNLKGSEELLKATTWIAEHINAYDVDGFFAKKLREDIVLISEKNFGFFVNNHTSVEPHVKIDPKTGTAEGSALFYVENLPPETLLAGLVMASRVRSPEAQDKDASWVLDQLSDEIDKEIVQFGGDATYGRGLMQVGVVELDLKES